MKHYAIVKSVSGDPAKDLEVVKVIDDRNGLDVKVKALAWLTGAGLPCVGDPHDFYFLVDLDPLINISAADLWKVHLLREVVKKPRPT
ncbi:MAG: hypothetical protein KGI60_02705 [Patescibacteria group bacterium]|nr:hypothetical protein [Patescibacteria group bacterium]